MTQDINVALYGAGGGGVLMQRCLEGTGCRVAVFFDAEPSKQGKTLNGVPVDAPKNVHRHDYACIIVASTAIYEQDICNTLLALGVPREKIIPRTLLVNNVAHKIREYEKAAPVRVCASGMSYHRQAIVPQFSSYSIFNYAQTSQDLFYDCAIARALLEAKSARPQFWLVGLTYYSLHYDLSLSKPWPCVFYYKDLFGHHNLSEERKGHYLNRFSVEGLSGKLGEAALTNIVQAEYQSLVLDNDKTSASLKAGGASPKQAQADGNKWYPKTVAENKALLEEHVRLLARSGITPVFAFVPFPAAYPIRRELAEECFEFIAHLEREYGCHTLNGYALEGFTDGDFYDASHLNIHGGRKYTGHVDAFLKRLA